MAWSSLLAALRNGWWPERRGRVDSRSAPAPLPAAADLPPQENVGESGWIQYGELEPTGGARDFAELEARMSALFALLRLDLARSPAQREFVLAQGAGEFRYGGD